MNFDKLYEDFTNQVLPKIQEGLVLTKDYAFDLFERYITYLIFTDVLTIIWSIIWMIIALIALKKLWKVTEDYQSYDRESARVFWGFVLFVVLIWLIWLFVESTKDLIKAVFIPEVRIYEEFKDYNK